MIKFSQIVARDVTFSFCKNYPDIVDWGLDQSPFLLINEHNCFMKVKIITSSASNLLWQSYQNIPEIRSKLCFDFMDNLKKI